MIIRSQILVTRMCIREVAQVLEYKVCRRSMIDDALQSGQPANVFIVLAEVVWTQCAAFSSGAYLVCYVACFKVTVWLGKTQASSVDDFLSEKYLRPF